MNYQIDRHRELGPILPKTIFIQKNQISFCFSTIRRPMYYKYYYIFHIYSGKYLLIKTFLHLSFHF